MKLIDVCLMVLWTTWPLLCLNIHALLVPDLDWGVVRYRSIVTNFACRGDDPIMWTIQLARLDMAEMVVFVGTSARALERD